ncbi:hypothetical protein GGC64_001968 [Mycobacterium sp. OAS707]|uniref:class I SAM-dependent methyltransferase n=1 Tax=Mycobacterium sp. OAS707 TaxID=2663822 RepID=UPI00178B4F3E|nr:class I SAM-dependent methyltransferase [Mycobacterium sp. OAS707]MBE1547960.1 hypothetical protein [Mycobacterium sp. OAS707]
MGDEYSGSDIASADIVERRLLSEFDVKMGINIVPANTSYPFMVADARDLPFEENYVDFALANAIIEHVGTRSDQARMVSEMSRVARCWVITTPNLWFPIEAHTATVLLHWLPSWRQRRADRFRLLSKRDFESMLPEGARIDGSFWSPTFTAYYCGQCGARSEPVHHKLTNS